MTQAKRPLDTFVHCPKCGSIEFQKYHENGKRCRACGYTLFSNPASAAAVFLLDEENQFLGIRRERDPRRGTWAIPGGFVDTGETLEAAAIRETCEEVGLEVCQLSYLCSYPNDYVYAGIKYATTDSYFISRNFQGEVKGQVGEVAGSAWIDPYALDLEELAFPSTVNAVRALQAYLEEN